MVRRRSPGGTCAVRCAVSNHEATHSSFKTRRRRRSSGRGSKSLDHGPMISTAIEASSAPLEKIALETYVPPAKPSLVGLSRAEIAEQLAAIGVTPAQR